MCSRVAAKFYGLLSRSSLRRCAAISRAMLLLIMLSGVNVGQAHTFGSVRNPVICMAGDILDGQTRVGGRWKQANKAVEMLAAIDPKSTLLCEEYVNGEIDRLRYYRDRVGERNCVLMADEDLDQVFPTVPLSIPKADRDAIFTKAKQQLASVVNTCKEKVTAEMILAANPALSSRYKEATDREVAAAQKAAEAVVAQAARESLVQAHKNTARNFEIKGLSLATTKAQLLALGSPKGEWGCKLEPQTPGVEICSTTFASSTCSMVAHPFNPDLRIPKCDTTFVQPADVSPKMRSYLTVAGVQVKMIKVSFYEGQVMRLAFDLDGEDPALRSALAEKYSQPDKDTQQSTEWFGLDEMLGGRGSVYMERPSLIARAKQRSQEADEAAQQEHQRKAQELTNRKKKDI